MGEIIVRKVRGMNWMAKISLVLIFTLVFSTFMYQGWYNPKKAEAALSYVGGTSGTNTAGAATYSVSLTGLGIAAGDLVIVVTGFAGTADGNPGVTTTGYTELFDLWADDTRDANLSVNWKIMGSTPDTSVTVNGSGNTANGAATVVHIWRGADTSTPMDVTATSATGININTPDSPAITPITAGAIVLSAGGGSRNNNAVTMTAPSGYSNPVSIQGLDTTLSFHVGVASKAWSGSGAEDPAAWGTSSTFTSDSWAAGTLAIRPAPSGDALTTSNPTNLTTANPADGAQNLDMLRFQVDSSNADSGTVELSTLTMSDSGNATSIANADVYISTVSQATLPGTAVLIGSTGAWNGNSTVINLTGGTAADRTVTNGTPKYIYIVYDLASGQVGNTIQANVSAVGVASPDSGVSGLTTYTSTSRTIQSVPHEDVGTGLNTPIATSPQLESKTGVLMQRFQVTSATSSAGAQDGQVELNSLGITDLGTASGSRTAKVYIDDSSAGTLPGTAVLIGSISGWTGGATSITLDQGTAGNRTVTNATPRYIYIVYDLPAGATQTVQSRVTSVGVVSPDAGQTGLTLNSTAITLSADPSKITSCAGCHAFPAQDSSTRNNPSGAVVGSHTAHNGNVCSTCHVTPATETSADYGHRNGNIELKIGATAIGGGYYDRDNSGAYSSPADTAWTQTNNPTTRTCRNVGCHGGVQTPQWGVGTVVCNTCHSNSMDAGDGAPTRRAVFGEFQNNAIGHMQYNVAAGANATVKADCTKCHAESTASHVNNTLDNGRAGAPGGATIAQPAAAAFCLDCHKSGATNNSFSTQSRTSPNIDGSGWTAGTTAKSGTGNVVGMQSHRVAATGGCADCHGDGAGNARVHGGSVNNLMLRATQYATCFNGTSTACHGSSSTIANTGARIQLAASATGGIHSMFGSAVTPKSTVLQRATLGTTTATDGGDDLFVRGWLPSSQMVCSDCHSQNGTTGVRGPHGSAYGYILKGADQTAITTATSGRTLGTPRPGTMTFNTYNQENLCINCHASDIYSSGVGGENPSNKTVSAIDHGDNGGFLSGGRCGISYFENTNGGTKSARIGCLNCHAGSNPAGGYGAHGSTRGLGGFASTGFQNGDAWTAAATASSCYATSAVNNWSGCDQGNHN